MSHAILGYRADVTDNDEATIEIVTEEQFRASSGLRRTLLGALPLLAGVALLMAGNGLSATLLGVRAGLEGFSPTVTGIVLSAFYMGFLAGSLITPRTIWRVGHVRVFAGLASLGSAALLIHIVHSEPATWFVLRMVSGLCLAGLYVANETWMNGAATNSTRGGLLAAYMVVVAAGQGVGQLLFPIADPQGHAAFVLGSVLISVAVVPVALATVSPPQVLEVKRMSFPELWRAAPLAVVAAAMSGLIGAAVLGGGGAVYASAVGLTRGQTSALLSSVPVGALVLQIPFGRWSDRTDRRRVVVAVAVLGVAGGSLAAMVSDRSVALLVVLTAVAGGASFLLYSLANAHLNDHLDAERLVGGGAAMVLVFGAGAVAGPVAASTAIDITRPASLFLLVAASYVLVALVGVWRLVVAPAVAEEERATYSPVPMGTAPTVATLSDASPEALHPEPADEAVVPTARGTLTYHMQGAGPPVVLLGETTDGAEWPPLLSALAADGLQAVGVEMRAADRDDEGPREDILAVLHDLELPSATFVGLNGGSVHIAELAAEHPDRTDAVVFAGPAMPVPADRDEYGGRALLLLTEDRAMPYWEEPALFADAIATFVRDHVATEAEGVQ